MTRDCMLKPGLACGVAAVVFGLFGGVASAQAPGARYDTSVGEVVVHPQIEGRDPATGAPIYTVTASRDVEIGDLDLNSAVGQRVARDRIERAASDACDYLDKQFVTLDSGSQDCFNQAVSNALDQVEGIVGHPIYRGWAS